MKKSQILIITAIAGFLLFIFVLASSNPQIVPSLVFNGLKIAIMVSLSAIVVDLLSFLLVNIWFGRIHKKQPSKLLKLVVSFLLYGGCAFIILNVLGQNTTGFTITSALVTAIFGFAMKDPLGNLLAGLFLQMDRPFDIGDSIEFKGLQGVVESIDWRSTDIRLPTGELNYIPNGSIMNDSVKLLNTDRVYRTVDFIAAATIPPHRVMDVVTQSVLDRSHPNINLDRPVSVRMASYGLSEISYQLCYYPNCHLEAIERTEPEIRCRIWYALSRIDRENNSQTIEQKQLLKLIDNFDFFKSLSIDAKNLIIEKSPRLLFDSNEVLNSQNILFPAMFIVVKGAIEIEQELVNNADRVSIKPFSHKPKFNSNYQLQPRVVEQVAARLSQYIGPVAFALTDRMAERVSSVYWLYENLAPEIENLEQRRAFLQDRPTAPTEKFQPGDCFGEMALFLGYPLPQSETIAVAETELLALTPAILMEVLDRERISIDTVSQYITQYHHDFLHRSLQEVSSQDLTADEISSRMRQHLMSK